MDTTAQTLLDGGRNAAFQFTGYSSDGSEETDVVKIDVSELTPPCRRFKPLKIEYSVQGGAVKLRWADGALGEDFLILTGQGCYDYEFINGLPNTNLDANGDMLLSTVDFEIGSSYSLMIEGIKKF